MKHCVIPAAPHWCVPWSLTLSVATEIGDTTTASPPVAATPAAVTIRTNASAVPPSDGASLLAVAGTNISVVLCNRCVFGDDKMLERSGVGTYYNCLPNGSLRVTTGCNAACPVCQDAQAVFPNATRSLVPFEATSLSSMLPSSVVVAPRDAAGALVAATGVRWQCGTGRGGAT